MRPFSFCFAAKRTPLLHRSQRHFFSGVSFSLRSARDAALPHFSILKLSHCVLSLQSYFNQSSFKDDALWKKAQAP